jgi:hypothetical protein
LLIFNDLACPPHQAQYLLISEDSINKGTGNPFSAPDNTGIIHIYVLLSVVNIRLTSLIELKM